MTGLSMGGFATWSLAVYQPNRFAALAPICGGGEPITAKLRRYILAPKGHEHISPGQAQRRPGLGDLQTRSPERAKQVNSMQIWQTILFLLAGMATTLAGPAATPDAGHGKPGKLDFSTAVLVTPPNLGATEQKAMAYCVAAVAVVIAAEALTRAEEGAAPKGLRPYELEWAKRQQDTRPPLVDFEHLDGWTVQSEVGQADLTLSKDRPLWGEKSAKLVYRGSNKDRPASFVLRPPRPIKLPAAFDCATLWVWSDVWMWRGDKGKPEWWLLHVRLNAAQREAVAAGATLAGVRLFNCRLDEEKTIYLDHLAFYSEPLSPVACAVQPQPGIDLPPAQDLGVQKGSARLPFPTREETLLPENLATDFKTELVRDGADYVFRYRGSDDTLEYRYRPATGTLGDVSAKWQGAAGNMLRPLAEGGVRLTVDRNVEGLLNTGGVYLPAKPQAVAPEKIEPLECRLGGDTVVSRWRVARGRQSAVVAYTLRLWQKSLLVDVRCGGGEVGEVSLGGVAGADRPRLVSVPYWTGEDLGADRGRPALLVMGPAERPLFCSVFLDHAESFTFRTVPAPGKGGDEGQRTYARQMQELGFRYGVYNNYTDFVPLNAHWNEDLVSRTPDGQWQTAWFRCYAPKPAQVAALEQTLTPIIQEKFHLNAG